MCLGVVVSLAVAATATAHHSPAAFDLGAQVTFEGTISRLDWVNPHVYIHVDTAATTGETVQWLIETDPTPILIRSGWSKEMVKVGTMVTVRGNPDRDTGRNHSLLVSMALPNGVVLTPRSAGVKSTTRAVRVAGVWNGLRGFGQRRLGTFKPTAKGLAAMKAYSEALNPVTDCVPVPSVIGGQSALGSDTVTSVNRDHHA